jgi:hypothetical protein
MLLQRERLAWLATLLFGFVGAGAPARSYAAPPDGLAVAEEGFQARHNARVARFRATGDLPEFLAYLVRLQEDPAGVLGATDPDTESGRRDGLSRDLASLGASLLIVEWSDRRPNELAPALLAILTSPEAAMRRGAARLIGASALKTNLQASASTQPQWSRTGLKLRQLRAVDRLQEVLRTDPDPSVQAAAKMALERIASVPPSCGCCQPCCRLRLPRRPR